MLMLTHLEREHAQGYKTATSSAGVSPESIPSPPIVWVLDGKAFSVRRRKELVSDVLPQFFRESKYTSFTRKLYRWGFRQISLTNERVLLNKKKRLIGGENMEMVYAQENFQRNNRALMSVMRSVTSATKKKSSKGGPSLCATPMVATAPSSEATTTARTMTRVPLLVMNPSVVGTSSAGALDIGTGVFSRQQSPAPVRNNGPERHMQAMGGPFPDQASGRKSTPAAESFRRLLERRDLPVFGSHERRTLDALIPPTPTEVAMTTAVSGTNELYYQQQQLSNLLFIQAVNTHRQQQQQQQQAAAAESFHWTKTALSPTPPIADATPPRSVRLNLPGGQSISSQGQEKQASAVGTAIREPPSQGQDPCRNNPANANLALRTSRASDHQTGN